MRKIKIRGHIQFMVNEICDDGEKIAYLVIDDDQVDLLGKLSDLIVYDVDNDIAEAVPEKYRQHWLLGDVSKVHDVALSEPPAVTEK